MVEVSVNLPSGGEVRLVGRVTWARAVPPGMSGERRGGFGLELSHADEAWFVLCAESATEVDSQDFH